VGRLPEGGVRLSGECFDVKPLAPDAVFDLGLITLNRIPLVGTEGDSLNPATPFNTYLLMLV
jgi:hypothetical protein